ncbi:uncharacterized protein LODBEIA_P32210 [Lodderomyces beijingensis]|uniref:TATA-binding protein interacting (TIP20) domain-containing protein n=1 Tax=Lodderomyces beijingensis TaxID=1775926 RepID=A0ABP0ZLG8_9ASCO
MPDINFNLLQDRAKDVDPDIRFMALEDLRKFLSDDTATLSRASISYNLDQLIPTLLKMLDDANPDVQNQAIKSFEPMVRYLNNNSIYQLVAKLFTLVQASNKKGSSSATQNFRSFTISIPNMALRSLFAQSNSRDKSEFVSDKLSKSNYKFNRELARQILDHILPLIVDNETTFDNIELLIDLISEIGYVLTGKEMLRLAEYFIKVSFGEQGIIGKRALVGVEKILALITKEQYVSNVVDYISNQAQESRLMNKKFVLFQSYSVVIRRGIKPKQVATIYTAIVDEINVNANPESDAEELDFDVLELQNSLKEEAFNTLIDLVKENFLPLENKGQVFDIISTFLKYDPLNSNEDQDFEVDDDDEIVFSDDEFDGARGGGNGGDYDNDGSWKIRAKAAILTRSLLCAFPDMLESISSQILPELPFTDLNDQVVLEAVKSSIAIVEATSPRDAQNLRSLAAIIDSRLVDVKEEQIPVFLKLVESLNRFNNAPLIESTFTAIIKRHINSASSLEYLQFYTSVLKFHDDLSLDTMNHIANDLASNLEDKSFNMISESLKCLKLVFSHRNSSQLSNLNQLVEILISKVENRKRYPSELVRLAIATLGEALANKIITADAKILQVLEFSLSYEETSRASIDVLTSIIHSSQSLPQDYLDRISEELQRYIVSNNDALSASALVLLNSIALQIAPSNKEAAGLNLLQLLSVTNSSNYEHIFQILHHWADVLSNSMEFTSKWLSTIVKLVNENKISLDNETFFKMVKAMCTQSSSLHKHLQQSLNPDFPTSAKLLAVCVDDEQKVDLIKRQMQEFEKFVNQDINNPRFAVVVLFLAFAQGDEQVFRTSVLVDLLRSENLTNETNIKALVTALGHEAKQHPDTALDPILDAYSSEKDNNNNNNSNSNNTVARNHLISALKVAISAFNNDQKAKVWNAIFNLSSDFDQALIPELRNSGDVLGEIALPTDESIMQQAVALLSQKDNNRTVYLVLVLSKYLLTNFEFSTSNERLLTFLTQASVDSLDIVNKDIRQIAVGNLLTGIHTMPSLVAPILNSVIIPKLLQQLTAENSFKKVIAMGPYKYVLDEGAEIRKLCYEFIYSVLVMENTTLAKHDVDIQLITRSVIDQGLVDSEPEVVVLACNNLSTFFELHEHDAVDLIRKGNVAFVEGLTENLNKQLSKKLSPKASSQETEKYQDRIKSIIKLSKKINFVFDSMQSDYNENIKLFETWNKYIADVKQNFTVYYSSTTV